MADEDDFWTKPKAPEENDAARRTDGGGFNRLRASLNQQGRGGLSHPVRGRSGSLQREHSSYPGRGGSTHPGIGASGSVSEKGLDRSAKWERGIPARGAGMGQITRGAERGRPRGRRGHMAPMGRGRQFLDNDQNEHNQQHQRGYRKMGFMKLEELAYKQDPAEVLHSVMATRAGFWDLINADEALDIDKIIHILHILQTATTCTSSPTVHMQCLNNIRTSKLISQHLGVFFIGLTSQPILKQRRMLESVRHYLHVCQYLLDKMPSCYDQMLVSLTSLHYFIGQLKKETELIDEDLNSQLDSVMKRCQERPTRNLQRARKMDRLQDTCADDLAPPNDFHETDVFPSLQDLTIEDKPFLRANKVTGAYKSVDHYLDVQFRLLREDFIQPLRKGIHEYLKHLQKGVHARKLQDLRLYHDVRILYPVCNHNGLSYRLRFDTTSMGKVRWESSKRLIYGSLICLSKDDFQTMMFATVTNHNVKWLSNGEIEVHFEHNAEAVSDVSSDESFVMAETTAFFEAYRHVLQALKDVDEGSFPFKEQIVDCKKGTDLPKYFDADSEINLSPLFDDSIKVDCPDLSESESETEEDAEVGIMDEIRRKQKNRHRQQMTEQRQLLKKVPDAMMHVKLSSNLQWPNAEDLHLDTSQMRALQAGLTQKFAIIQGPPGTGKTYLGLKIAKTLLYNQHLWGKRNDRRQPSPILVVCYTNHALDQFLEGISQFQHEGIVRVGGRSKSEVLQKYLIKEKRRHVREGKLSPQHARQLYYDAREEMKSLDIHMTDISAQIDVADRGIIHEDILQGAMSDEHHIALRAISAGGFQYHQQGQKTSGLLEWMGVGAHVFTQEIQSLPVDENEGKSYDGDHDEDIEIEEESQFIAHHRMTDDEDKEALKKDKQRYHVIQQHANEQLAFQLDSLNMNDSNDEEWQISKTARKNNKKRILHELRKTDGMTSEEASDVTNILSLPYPERWRLYRFWLSVYKNRLRQSTRQMERRYQAASERLKTAGEHEDMYIMQNAVVIGMTTTCAARCHIILQQVKPKIVIVEEAAEVLEAHIVTTLSDGCEHLILIGDHQQLRPNPAVYELAEKYSLKISLFERMINNGQNVVTLENQHRMRPEISSVMQHIYPNLKDHESVLSYEQVRGVASSVFFVDHRQPEKGDAELKSKSNDFEAEYIAKLCKYLLHQGYQPSQITILTPYTGQLIALKRYMPKKSFEGVRVCAVDNYQGEENDIVLLSLVRSNSDGKLGFLAEDNRVCVLLSRAKMGFYAIGNFSMLANKTLLWESVVHTLKKQKMIGPSLGLFCTNHPKYKIDASEANDFDKAPEGGCLKPCVIRLDCGHACALVCHPYDKDHQEYQCRKSCTKVLCERGHQCPQLCYEVCNDCIVPVRREIPTCGHMQNIPCYVETDDFSCKEPCQEQLPCGHMCQNSCGSPVHTTECKKELEKELPCGHKASFECCMDPQDYPCSTPCISELSCGHPCPGTCGGCFNGRLHAPCKLHCGRVLVCGHLCKTSCPNACPPCKEKCQNRCMHSKCDKKCGMPCTPCKERCEWHCKHIMACSKFCSEPCDRERCNEPCHEILKCGHQCIGMCGERCPTLCRVCNKDDVEEIFFGSEDEPGARFVQLEDCGHIFEVESMDTYMDLAGEISEGKEVIQMKKCPKCAVIIKRNLRYGQVIKDILADIEIVKKKIAGSRNETKTKQDELVQQVDALTDCIFSERLSDIIERPLTPEEVRTIENVIVYHKQLEKSKKTASKYLGMTSANKKLKEVLRQIKRLEQWLSRHVRTLHMSEQELLESFFEATRIQMLVGAYKLYYYVHVRNKAKLEEHLEKSFNQVIEDLLRNALTKELEDSCRAILKKVEKVCPVTGLRISDEERISIVAAMDLEKGHWFKCPKGHVYAIGECGGAMVEATCPECGSTIGGQSHALRADNALASEMDQANHPAWSEQANMQNYEF